jgi:hypothetical protein
MPCGPVAVQLLAVNQSGDRRNQNAVHTEEKFLGNIFINQMAALFDQKQQQRSPNFTEIKK